MITQKSRVQTEVTQARDHGGQQVERDELAILQSVLDRSAEEPQANHVEEEVKMLRTS